MHLEPSEITCNSLMAAAAAARDWPLALHLLGAMRARSGRVELLAQSQAVQAAEGVGDRLSDTF